MVEHWRRAGGPDAGRSMAINGAGAVCTAVTLVVVLVSKFAEGAWVMILLIPALLVLFTSVHRHYRSVARQVASSEPLDARGPAAAARPAADPGLERHHPQGACGSP